MSVVELLVGSLKAVRKVAEEVVFILCCYLYLHKVASMGLPW